MKPILIASDHAGFALKAELIKHLLKKRLNVRDLGTYTQDSCDYPFYAYLLAKSISRKKSSRGILICKTGIGNSIVANRFPGVRASLCTSVETAKLTRQHNDSNVLVLGSGFTTESTAKKILDAWLAEKFEGGRHKRRLNILRKIEEELGAEVK